MGFTSPESEGKHVCLSRLPFVPSFPRDCHFPSSLFTLFSRSISISLLTYLPLSDLTFANPLFVPPGYFAYSSHGPHIQTPFGRPVIPLTWLICLLAQYQSLLSLDTSPSTQILQKLSGSIVWDNGSTKSIRASRPRWPQVPHCSPEKSI